jgi:tyrosine-protein phosphatase YwqE
MFWISKKTATYSEAWKDGFVDIHNHLLPGIDDGAKSIAQTETMIHGMQELGITEAIATPHTYPGLWQNTQQTIQTSFETVPHGFITACSSEYLADTSLLELAENNSLLPLKGDYILIEFAMLSAPVSGLMETLFALKLKGYRLILAHPERYLYWEKNLRKFEELKSFDLELQLNALSLLGYYGEPCKKVAEYLLQNELYTFLGTDFHAIHHIDFTKNHTFAEKHLQKIMLLVAANEQFSNLK